MGDSLTRFLFVLKFLDGQLAHFLHLRDLFIGKQRAQAEYAMLRGKDVDGWTVEIVDGSKVMWEEIDLKP